MDNLEFEIKLSDTDYKYLLVNLSNYKKYRFKKNKKEIIYTLQDTKNKNILIIEKRGFYTSLIYRQLYIKNDICIGYDEFKTKCILNKNVDNIFSIINNTYGLKVDTNFKLKAKNFEKYIDRVYVPFIKEKTIIKKSTYKVTVFKTKDIQLDFYINIINNNKYSLKIKYIQSDFINDDKKLEIQIFLKKLLKYLFNINY